MMSQLVHKGHLNLLIKSPASLEDLTDIDASGWNDQMVERVFVPATASLIKSSDRNLLPVMDVACWKSSKDGSFSLKAAYWDYNKSQFDEKNEACRRIWQSNIHERFKVFLWKLCQDALPFSSKLQSLFGKPLGDCSLCGCESGDDVGHFVSGCPVTTRLWFSSRWGLRPDALSFQNGRDLISWLSQPPFQSLLQPKDSARFFLYGAVLYHKLSEVCRGVMEIRWGLPRPGRVRGYVDFASAREFGAGAVVFFDSSGGILACGAKKIMTLDVLQGELEALLFGVSLAKDLQLVGVDFFTDNSLLVKGLIDKSSPSWLSHFSFAKLYELLVSLDCSVS
uniref:Reverse transcriptase zinc-binding domain-containing protein n=1 Tax=Cannabis sativa TaxID=3483 RepID=A0A803QKF1_CANSA